MRTVRLFLALVVLQAWHSLEEYAFHLYDVFPPARFISELVSPNRARGFVIVNVAIVSAAICCYVWPVRQRWPSSPMFVLPWVVIELINGIGHPAWSLVQGEYTPGVVTAVPLLVVSVLLGVELVSGNRIESPGHLT